MKEAERTVKQMKREADSAGKQMNREADRTVEQLEPEVKRVKTEKTCEENRQAERYCFFSGKSKVTMCFSDNGRTIEERLMGYLLALAAR